MNWVKAVKSVFWAIVSMAVFNSIWLSIKWVASILPVISVGSFLVCLAGALLSFLIYRELED